MLEKSSFILILVLLFRIKMFNEKIHYFDQYKLVHLMPLVTYICHRQQIFRMSGHISSKYTENNYDFLIHKHNL